MKPRKPLELQLEVILRRLKERQGGMDYAQAIKEIRTLFKRTYGEVKRELLPDATLGTEKET